MTQPKLLDTVAILSPLPYDRLIQIEPDKLAIDTLPIGLIGTVVETYDKPETYLMNSLTLKVVNTPWPITR
jgi:hypothetical protein